MSQENSTSQFQGKTAIISGGAEGIGLSIAKALGEQQMNVVLADIDRDNLERARLELQSLGVSVLAVSLDVADEGQWQSAAGAAIERFGKIHMVVNNAGVIAVAPLIETEADQWVRLLDINVVGVAMGSKVGAKQMISQGVGGCIVNASSGGGRHGVANVSQYCASKAAIIMLSQSLSQEVAQHKIRVNCYTPGHIMTPLWEDIIAGMGDKLGRTRDETLQAFAETIPWGRFGTPEDVAGTVSWLCTPDAEYISGQCIAMNGAELPW